MPQKRFENNVNMEEKHLTFMANKQTRDISLAIFFASLLAIFKFAAENF
jgi:hypothetical protein